MNYKRLIAVTVGFTIFAVTGSNVMAHGGGGGGHGGGGFGGGGFHGGGFGGGGFRGGGFRSAFNSGGFRGGGFNGNGFRNHGFGGDRFRHRNFNDRFFFFDDFGDPFLDYPYSYYGYYPYDYGYGSYDSYNQPVYQSSARYTDSVIGEVQLRLARGGYYHGSIDGVSGNATRKAIRAYEQAHALPQDGRIGQRLLATMGVG